MEDQNNISSSERQTAGAVNLQDAVVQPSDPVSVKPKGKFSTPIVVGVVLVFFLVIASGVFFLLAGKSKLPDTTDDGDAKQEVSYTTEKVSNQVDLESILKKIETTYGGNIPWVSLNNRQGYKFYTNEISGLTLVNDEVSTNHDNNYNPITVFNLGEKFSVPVKNAYISYYEIPEVLSKKYGVARDEIVFPVELMLDEIDRPLTQDEKTILMSGDHFTCTNDKSETAFSTYSDDKIAIHYCDVNLTKEQREQVEGGGFFDIKTEIYLIDRNILIWMGFDSSYIDSPQAYLTDYLSKLFNSNDSFFVSQSQVRSVEDSREFEEWRSKTFDNQ